VSDRTEVDHSSRPCTTGCIPTLIVSPARRIWRRPCATPSGHWAGLVAFLDDGRIEMDSNTVVCTIRPHTLTRKNSLFAGRDGGARHWAIAMTMIQTAK
jgi:hypothetical protein